MGVIRGSADSDLLPIEPSDEFVRPVELKPVGVRLLKAWPSLRRRAVRVLASLPIAFCTGLAIGLLRQSYGDAAKEMIANSHPPLRWLATEPSPIALNSHPSDIIVPVAPSSTEQLNAMSFDLNGVGQNNKIGTSPRQEQV